MSTNTDDDDISIFVQDIDARKPLSGHHRTLDQEHGHSHDRDTRVGVDKVDTHRRDEKQGAGSVGKMNLSSGQSSASGPMLTSEMEVDERLRQMNEAFMASLKGLGGSTRRKDRRQIEDSGESGSRSGRGGVTIERRRTANLSSAEVSGTSQTPNRDRDRESGRGPLLLMGRPRHGSGSTSTSDAGGQGSEEVIGRLELDDGRRRSRGQ